MPSFQQGRALVGAERLANGLLHGAHGLRDLAANLRVRQRVNGALVVANAGCAWAGTDIGIYTVDNSRDESLGKQARVQEAEGGPCSARRCPSS